MLDTENRRRLIMLSVLLAGVTAVIIWRDRISVDALAAGVAQLGWLAPLVFVLVYAVAAVFLMPGLLFTFTGGVLFGPLHGTIYNLIGATLGATLAFLTARYIAHDWVAERSGKRTTQLIAGVEREGWRFVALTRLVPVLPYNLLNYALGLTNIRLSHYVAATFIFMIPSGAAYTYLGYAGREVAAGGEGVIKTLLLALAVIATIAFGSRIYMRIRRDRMKTE
jgi:uncharacterized membrane protein YdjX (TVP38/TMEM64 family)